MIQVADIMQMNQCMQVNDCMGKEQWNQKKIMHEDDVIMIKCFFNKII